MSANKYSNIIHAIVKYYEMIFIIADTVACINRIFNCCILTPQNKILQLFIYIINITY